MNTEFSCFITGGGNHASCGSTADRKRLAAQLGIIPLFHRRVKGIHVDVDDLSGGWGSHSVHRYDLSGW